MKTLIYSIIAFSFIFVSCNQQPSTKNIDKTATLSEEYNLVPKEELLQSTPLAKAMYDTLSNRYIQDLTQLKSNVESLGAKFSLIYLTPECGNSQTQSQRVGKEMIEREVTTQQIDYLDLSKSIEDQDPLVVTQMPKDGHLSKEGARIVSASLAEYLKKFQNYQAPALDALKNKPTLLGDLTPNQDEILDGGKDLPYRMITNSQGLRLKENVTFPKKKQRILLFGDSVFFCPFLDNDNGISTQVQNLYPDAEIIPMANWGYSLDDYLTLLEEKGKFLEPDVILVQTSGNDILDYYFSNRLKLSRNKESITPSPQELSFYKTLQTK
ncbi:MAG TPA: hypothetical protein PLU10_06090 [Chitinophagaceae bacterium]|nr:hypothetical protein [Chitinophagaceae bacterium]